MKILFHSLVARTSNIKKIPWLLGTKAFLIILFSILLYLMLGVFLFYKYIVLVEITQPQSLQQALRFDYNAYQQVSKTWQVKEQGFAKTEDKQYGNPFVATP